MKKKVFIRIVCYFFATLVIPLYLLCEGEIVFRFKIETKFEVDYGTSDIDEIDNEIFLANPILNSITVVNIKGEKLRVIGRQGQGPGEFGLGSPKSILVSDGKIIASDIGSLKLYIFDLNGNLLKQYRLMTEIPVFPILKFYPINADQIGIYGHAHTGITSEGISIVHKFITFNLRNGNFREIYTTPPLTVNMKAINPFSGFLPPLLMKNLILQPDKDLYKIEVFSIDGKRKGSIKKETKSVSISERVIKYIEGELELIKIKSQGMNFSYPKKLPAIRAIVFLNKKLIVWTWKSWYENNFERNEKKYYVDIFNLNGNYIGEGVTLFNPEEVIRVKREKVYLLCKEGDKKFVILAKLNL